MFETAENATCIVQVDEGSNFILSEKTRLAIHKADSRVIEFYLQEGSIVASVSKRKRNQSFSIATPDARCKVVGTVFSVSVRKDSDNKNITNLTVIEGEVAIFDKKDPAVSEQVKTGQTVFMQNSILTDPHQASDDQLNVHSTSVLKIAAEMSKEETVPSGLLDIKSNPPGATIFIEDMYIGKTPMALNYPAGNYELKLTLPGYEHRENTNGPQVSCRQL